jgi:cytochrome c biogenesis protein CcdA
MTFLVLGAFVAGVLTTLAPCVLPLLPVIVGGSLAPGGTAPVGRAPIRVAVGAVPVAGGVVGPEPVAGAPSGLAPRRRALVVTASLGISVLVFTLLLQAGTALLGVPTQVWAIVSGGLLIGLGLVQLAPSWWERVAQPLDLQGRSHRLLRSGRSTGGTLGAVLTGAALGPVFSSCSPLYGYVVATVLPASPVEGLVLMTAYVVGLCGTLLLVALAGQRAVRRLRWTADPHGRLRRGVGVLLVVVGLAVATGVDRDVQTWLVEHNPLEGVTLFDQRFIPA